jgi:hypothetical protein
VPGAAPLLVPALRAGRARVTASETYGDEIWRARPDGEGRVASKEARPKSVRQFLLFREIVYVEADEGSRSTRSPHLKGFELVQSLEHEAGEVGLVAGDLLQRLLVR